MDKNTKTSETSAGNVRPGRLMQTSLPAIAQQIFADYGSECCEEPGAVVPHAGIYGGAGK